MLCHLVSKGLIKNSMIYFYWCAVSHFVKVACFSNTGCFIFDQTLISYFRAELILTLMESVLCVKRYHTCFHVGLFQSCRDYLSCQGTNAETVWNNLITRVHPVNFPLFFTTGIYILLSQCRICLFLSFLMALNNRMFLYCNETTLFSFSQLQNLVTQKI